MAVRVVQGHRMVLFGDECVPVGGGVPLQGGVLEVIRLVCGKRGMPKRAEGKIYKTTILLVALPVFTSTPHPNDRAEKKHKNYGQGHGRFGTGRERGRPVFAVQDRPNTLPIPTKPVLKSRRVWHTVVMGTVRRQHSNGDNATAA